MLCLLAAACFGSLAVLAKLAYDAGADLVTLLWVRFALAAAVLWTLAARRGVARVTRTPRAALDRKSVV